MQFSQKEKNRLKEKYGEWALVTGATSGIGRELASRLAEAGLKVIITGRRTKLLEELASDLFAQYQAEVVPVPGDLSDAASVQQLIQEIDSLPIGLAVLNAGFGTSGKFIHAEIEQEVNMLNLNCGALLRLSHHFARRFADQKKGGIILMSSMVAFQGVPNAANYAATKAYVQTLGEAIALELKGEGVDVLCAAPGPVKSGFAERADMRMSMALTPEQVGIPILKALGRKTNVLPGFLTKFLVYNLRMTPRWGKIRIMDKVMSGFTQHQLG
ncbi:MAG: SDR family NAD(P)-dependent oxidoreductase [Bacteroidota bacterium]